MKGLVLIVDDAADIRFLVRLTLELEGYEVIEASDADAAWATLGERDPDVVLLDVNLPQQDGLGILVDIRSDPKLHQIPVVMLSAHSSRIATELAREAGSSDYLVKPFTPQELVAAVDRAGGSGAA